MDIDREDDDEREKGEDGEEENDVSFEREIDH